MTKDASSSSTHIFTEKNEIESRETIAVMASAVAESRKTDVCPANDDTVVPTKRKELAMEKVQAEGRKLRSPAKEIRNKQSWDYIWRTGLAGGLAGSAVCTFCLILSAHPTFPCRLYRTEDQRMRLRGT